MLFNIQYIYIFFLNNFQRDERYYVLHKIIRYWPERKSLICFDGKCALSLCIHYNKNTNYTIVLKMLMIYKCVFYVIEIG